VQLRHRAEFLGAGYLDIVSATVAEHVEQKSDTRLAPRGYRVLDAGSGTSDHLAKIAAKITGPFIGLGLDISKDAARYASRRWPDLAFAVADLWVSWPVHDAVADLVVSIFAPKNFPETARVLRPGGWLALAYPGPDHLIELRQRFPLLRQHDQRARRYLDAIARLISPPTGVRLRQRVALDPAAVRLAILMGPSARHISPSILEESAPLAVTFDIHVLFARKPKRSC
jgi:23S rRNA (guanine745-N1)-methyltransferase